MSNQSYQSLAELHTQARQELSASSGTVKALVHQLRAGVSYNEAIEIINRFWEPREAQRLIVQLYDSFPQANGEIILNKGVDERMGKTITTDVTHQFFIQSSALLQTQIKLILSAVNSQPLDSEETVLSMNNVRKQIVKFLEYIKWGASEIRSQLLTAGPKSWESLTTDVDLIEKGDYLFLESLELLVDEAIKKFVERDLPEKWDMELSTLNYRFGSIDAVMEMIMLFAEYLTDYPLPGVETQ